MKIWLVPFNELDDRRVIAQHHEFHAIWNFVTKKGWKWQLWHLPEHRLALYEVHERIVEEMKIRGFEHNTPIEKPEITVPQKPYPVTLEQIQFQRWQLVCRWGGVYRGRPPMPPEYRPLIELYQEVGCRHDGATETITTKNGRKFELCLICKRYVRDHQGLWIPLEEVKR